MGETTKIEWCHHTFNPWRGCTKVAAGCANCYAESQAKRNPKTLGIWGDQGTRVVASEAMWQEPLKWNKQAAEEGVPKRVFCASMADVFEDWQGRPVFSPIKVDDELQQPVAWYGPVKSKERISDEICHAGQMLGCGAGSNFRVMFEKYRPATLDDVRRRLFALIDATPNLDWLLLTKRPDNILRMWPAYFPGGYISEAGSMNQQGARPNVWLGTSIATQPDADTNIPELLKCRDLAPVLFLSAEPLLGAVYLRHYLSHSINCAGYRHSGAFFPSHCNCGAPNIKWLIAGGESGRNAKPMHPDWARSLRDQCQAAGVPFFFKQWGEFGSGSINLMNGEPCFRYFSSKEQWINKASSWVNGGICVDQAGKICRVGSDFEQANYPVTIMHEIGKKAAGRLLDGREWNEFPEVTL